MKKKARRRATLGNNLVLFIQEGQNRVQQLDTYVKEQVREQFEQEASRPRQRALARCSSYRAVGHTIRSCPSK
jgi:hypothetical protein